jgi:hypothetical protein
MPDERTLRDRLGDHFDHFVEKTNFIKKVAGRDLPPRAIVMEVDTSFCEYKEILNQPLQDVI